MCFEFPYKLIGKMAMASLTGQSWPLLKSWHTSGDQAKRTWALFRRRYSSGFSYVTSVTQARFSLQRHYSRQLITTAELSLLRQGGKLHLPINTEFHLEVQMLFNMRTYEGNLEQK